jgi:hypothetical protein
MTRRRCIAFKRSNQRKDMDFSGFVVTSNCKFFLAYTGLRKTRARLTKNQLPHHPHKAPAGPLSRIDSPTQYTADNGLVSTN